MTMQEAAKMLKIGVRTLYRYLDSGRISRSYRYPGRRMLDREDVLAFLDKCADERTT
jgi:excisionase family DNA binding protein